MGFVYVLQSGTDHKFKIGLTKQHSGLLIQTSTALSQRQHECGAGRSSKFEPHSFIRHSRATA